MDPERWQRIGAVFHGALEHGAAERARFLDEACGRDAALRAEVDSLLAHHEDGAPPVVPTPPEAPGADEDAGGSGLPPGRRLGPYRITRQLGEGGMGVVHLAEDTRLGRLVAIKALPPPFARDERRRRRLRREARAAASLAHPGIATVYALEEFDGALCIVSEYVQGETLRQELAAGPLPPADLLDTAVAVARALAAAHEGNVLHRDLKPENVIRARDAGETAGLKLVDFGLACFDDPQADGASDTRLTAPGAVLGTPGYMAPEQIRGEPVDFRTDIFAFGVLLFELASGRHPFSGPTPVSTAARVLEAAPDLDRLGTAVPRALARIVRRCLQKDPAARYGDTRTLVADLERARHLTPPGAAATPAGDGHEAAFGTDGSAAPPRAAADGGREAAFRTTGPGAPPDAAADGGREAAFRTAGPGAPPDAGFAPAHRGEAGPARMPTPAGAPRPAEGAPTPAGRDAAGRADGFGAGRDAAGRADGFGADRPGDVSRRIGRNGPRTPEGAEGGASARTDRSARASARPAADGERLSPLWWWRFHQRAAGGVYYAMLYPLWQVRAWAPPPWGPAVFFAALAAVLVAANLRFHLSFTERFTPAQLDRQRAQSAPWIRAADWLFAALLPAAAALIAETRPAWASLTAAVGIVSAVTFLAIEPATTRAAFRDRPADPP